MRLRLVAGVTAFFVLAAAIFVALLFGPGLLASGTSTGNLQANVTSGNPIVLENAHLGTNSWKIPSGKEATTQIQAYASATSVLPGQKLTFYVSTQQEGTSYSIDIYRLGWYEGYGGRLMTSVPSQTAHAQGYYDSAVHRLVDCTSCHVDPKTGLVEANWHPSYTLVVPFDWTTGIYLAKFTDAIASRPMCPSISGATLTHSMSRSPQTPPMPPTIAGAAIVSTGQEVASKWTKPRACPEG